jgi:glutaredoxin 3
VARVLMYCTAACPFCQSAERLLARKGARIDKVRVDLEPARLAEMTQKSGGRRTVPQIWIGSRHVGGCDDLYALEREGKLDPLLEVSQ